MKNVRFKAWAKLTKVMIDEKTIFNNFDGYASNKNYEMLMFTGKKDKEKNDIFEGDRLIDEDGIIYDVVWEGSCFWLGDKGELHNEFMEDYTIVGNIYETN